MKKSTRNLLIAGGILLGGGLLLAGGGDPDIREQVLQESLRVMKLIPLPTPSTEQIQFARSNLKLVGDNALADLLACLRTVKTQQQANDFELTCAPSILKVWKDVFG